MSESSEFRNVHLANEALEIYKKTGSLDHLKSIPIYSIKRYDVWQCVFEGEENKPAYKLLQEKELYDTFLQYKKEAESCDVLSLRADLAVTCLNNIRGEQDEPYALTPLEALHIIVDCMGEKYLQPMLVSANWFVDNRRKIISKYTNKDNAWVGLSVEIRDMIQNYIQK